MQQLISIETVPISIEYSSTKGESKAKSASRNISSSASLNISKDDQQLTIKSNPIKIQFGEKFKQSAGQNMTYTATAEYSDNILSMNVHIQPGDKAASSGFINPVRFHVAGNGIDRMVDAVPRASSGVAPFESIKIKFNMEKTPESVQLADGANASFIPPDIQMDIVEHPKVVIKYIGGPIYFPKSSDPNYTPSTSDGAFETKV